MDMGELGVGKEGAIAITIVYCRLKRKREEIGAVGLEVGDLGAKGEEVKLVT